MLSYSIYETKARLSEVLRNVKKGTEVVVTERGVPIAKVVPFHEAEDLGQHIQNLIANKRILLAEIKGPFPKGIKRTGALKRFLRERE